LVQIDRDRLDSLSIQNSRRREAFEATSNAVKGVISEYKDLVATEEEAVILQEEIAEQLKKAETDTERIKILTDLITKDKGKGYELTKKEEAIIEALKGDLAELGQAEAFNLDLLFQKIKARKEENSLVEKGQKTFLGGFKSASSTIDSEIESFRSSLAEDATMSFRNNMQTALQEMQEGAKSFGDIMQDSAQGFLTTILDAINRNIANRIASNIAEGFSSEINNSNNGKGSFLSSIGQKIFAKGGLLNGPSHSQGGIPMSVGDRGMIEAEGGEGIINKRSMSSGQVMSVTGTPRQIASQINSMNGFGAQFASGGEVDQITSQINALKYFGPDGKFTGASKVNTAGLSARALMRNSAVNQERDSLLKSELDDIRSLRQQLVNAKTAEAYERAQAEYQRKLEKYQKNVKMATTIGNIIGQGFLSAGAGAISGNKGANEAILSAKNDTSLTGAQRDLIINDIKSSGSYKFGYNPYLSRGGTLPVFHKGGQIPGRGDVPIMAQGGEVVMSNSAVANLGSAVLQNANEGRVQKDLFGGASGPLTNNNEVNITINVDKAGNATSETESKGDKNKKDDRMFEAMSDKVKTVVLQTLTEEKRQGGMLSSTAR